MDLLLLDEITWGFIYLGSLIIGNLSSFYYHFNENNYTAVGASGAVSGILFSSILIYPEMELFIFFIPIPIPSVTNSDPQVIVINSQPKDKRLYSQHYRRG